MTRPTAEHLLAFLDGELDAEQRTRLLAAVERDPELARDLRAAAIGLAAVESFAAAPAPRAAPAAPPGRRISPWWAAAAAAATLAVSVPAALWVSSAARESAVIPRSIQPEPGFVVVLHGRWPDAGVVPDEEARARAREYWAWTAALADSALLMAAGDLRWEPGRRFGPNGVPVGVAADAAREPDFVVGMVALRVGTYDEAIAIALQCPHLRYGGSVSVRQVGRGFVVRGARDTLVSEWNRP